MKCLVSQYRGFLPLVTLLIGIVLGGFLPHIPLHAVATDRAETYLIATGLLDTDVEAVFFLDCLTGDLFAAVPGKTTGGFTGLYRYNVLKDLQIDLAKNPHFLMVTGLADLRSGIQAGDMAERRLFTWPKPPPAKQWPMPYPGIVRAGTPARQPRTCCVRLESISFRNASQTESSFPRQKP